MRKFSWLSILSIGSLLTSCLFTSLAQAEDGYDMWLRYQPVANESLRQEYQAQLQQVIAEGKSPTIKAAAAELQRGLSGLLAKPIAEASSVLNKGVVIGTPANSPLIAAMGLKKRLGTVGNEGYLIEQQKIGNAQQIVVAANTDLGVLYGSFHLLRLLQTEESLSNISISSAPKLQHRVVNHWDNVNRLVERGYAGLSLWDWGTLPESKTTRYTDYARINASLGINGTVINNVNADPRMLSDQFLKKIAALADVFRP